MNHNLNPEFVRALFGRDEHPEPGDPDPAETPAADERKSADEFARSIFRPATD